MTRNIVLCGVEEPFRPNPEFWFLDPSGQEYLDEDTDVPGLNRYSIVFHGDTDVREAETRIARVLLQNRARADWICVWDTPQVVKLGPTGLPDGVNKTEAIHPISLRWMEQTTRARKEQGWQFCSKRAPELTVITALQVATLRAGADDLDGFGPVGYDGGMIRNKIVLLFGGEQLPCAQLQNHFAAEMAFLSGHGSFTPRLSLLKWLAQTGIEVALSPPRHGSAWDRDTTFPAVDRRDADRLRSHRDKGRRFRTYRLGGTIAPLLTAGLAPAITPERHPAIFTLDT